MTKVFNIGYWTTFFLVRKYHAFILVSPLKVVCATSAVRQMQLTKDVGQDVRFCNDVL